MENLGISVVSEAHGRDDRSTNWDGCVIGKSCEEGYTEGYRFVFTEENKESKQERCEVEGGNVVSGGKKLEARAIIWRVHTRRVSMNSWKRALFESVQGALFLAQVYADRNLNPRMNLDSL